MTIYDRKSKRVDFEMKYIGWNIGAIRIERKESMGDIELLELKIDDVDILKKLEKLEAIRKICYSKRAPANEKIADIIHILEAEG